MSAANFCTMRDFPLFAKDYNEDAKRCPECGAIMSADATETEDKDYTNDDCHYYFDCGRSVAYRKYEAEIRKINRKLAALGKEYGFQEYVCTARFSNGEAWYDLASNSRARLKSVVA